MRKFSIIAGLAGAVLILTGCGNKEEGQPAEPGAETPAPQASVTTAPPARRAGLWEQVITAGDTPAQTVSMCIDAATDAKMAAFGSQVTVDQCSENTFIRNADGSYSFRNVCNMGSGGVVTSNGKVTGDFNSAYSMTMETTTTGAAVPSMNRTESVSMQVRWKGACPEGVNPGDMIMANGMVLNLTGMAGAAP